MMDYVGGLVNANKGAMLNEVGLDGELFNLGCGKEIKDIEAFETVRDTLGLRVEFAI